MDDFGVPLTYDTTGALDCLLFLDRGASLHPAAAITSLLAFRVAGFSQFNLGLI